MITNMIHATFIIRLRVRDLWNSTPTSTYNSRCPICVPHVGNEHLSIVSLLHKRCVLRFVLWMQMHGAV